MAIKPTLSNLKPPRGSRHRKVRVGRGMGSKLGKTSGAGNKGQQSRRGYSRRAGFEGGQMPLHRRLPKRGFSSPFRKAYAVVNVESLNVFEAGATIWPDLLFGRGIFRVQQSGERKDYGRRRKSRSLKMNPLRKLVEAFRNIFSTPDLRNRVLFTLALLGVYRLGSSILTPGINTALLQQLFEQGRGSVLGIIDLFSGGNFRRLTIFALGIMPYITASIILQLMVVVWPYLERLQKEGELGRRKITQYTRYLTIMLSAFQSFTIAETLTRQNLSGQALVYHPGPRFILMTMLTLTTGSAFIMWLGEQISDRGIGNGMSLIIFAGIVVGLPRAVGDLWEKAKTQQWGSFTPIALLGLIALMLAVVAFIVFMEGGQRRIPVQYAKRVMGRRVMGGQMTYLPLRVNSGGVIPPIFASSLLTFPQTLALFFQSKSPFFGKLANQIKWGEPLYTLIYVTLIIFFAFFYVGIIFNPTELADNMRKYGGFIPGIRPGRNTSEYINRILTRLTFVGGVYLAIVCLLPEWMISGIHLQHLWLVGDWFDQHMWRFVLDGLNVQFYFGGTSLLIVVGVAMDTVQQLEAQLVMRNYDGFVRKGRVRGRRN